MSESQKSSQKLALWKKSGNDECNNNVHKPRKDCPENKPKVP